MIVALLALSTLCISLAGPRLVVEASSFQSAANPSPLWLAELNRAERLLGITPDAIMQAALAKPLRSFLHDEDDDDDEEETAVRSKRVREKDFAKSKNIEDAPNALQSSDKEGGATHHIHVHVNHPRYPAPVKWQYIVIAALASLVASVGLVTAAACWYKIIKVNAQQKQMNSMGVRIGGATSGASRGVNTIGTGTQTNGDKRLAQSAQMYHFQQQKQQMIAAENGTDLRVDSSDEDDEMADAAEDFTVYECPGMAVAGEIEVQNPMFQPDRPSPTNSDGGVASNATANTTGNAPAEKAAE